MIDRQVTNGMRQPRIPFIQSLTMLRNQPTLSGSGFTLPLLRRAVTRDGFVAAVRGRQTQLMPLSDERLRERSDQARMLVHREGPDAPRAQQEAFALACEGLRRARGIELYDVQLAAAVAVAEGNIVEMQTGEGKTFSCAPAAFLHALLGKGVHVATPNAYLARRDYELLLPAYALLGVRVSCLPEGSASTAAKRQAYRCDIVYGMGYEFGFDYLRDQLTLRKASSRPLGAATLDSLFGEAPTTASLLQRELYYSIVDEADHVLLDDAASPLILSGAAPGEARDAAVHRAARSIVGELRGGEHYRRGSAASLGIQLTDAGIEWIHRREARIPLQQLERTWTEYVEQALRAAVLRRDVHYVVSDDGEIRIVDTGTGRIFSDRTWREGLHQTVEAKEGVRITSEKLSLAQITRQRFSRLYQRLSGMTGTAVGCEREFRQVYGLKVFPIPLRTPSRRESWPTRFFLAQSQKWRAIFQSIREIHGRERPVLVGTSSIADSEHLAQRLVGEGLDFQLLNGLQAAEEAAIIAQAGQRSAITIATSLAGRGTDIQLGAGVSELGGLHVIVSECSDSARVDRQLVGRSARQGDPGSTQMFVSAEDGLIQQHGAWLVSSIAREAGPDGEATADFSGPLRRLQRAAERARYAARSALLRHDLSRDSLFSRPSAGS